MEEEEDGGGGWMDGRDNRGKGSEHNPIIICIKVARFWFVADYLYKHQQISNASLLASHFENNAKVIRFG